MRGSMVTWAAAWMSIPAPVWKWIHRLGGPGLILLGIADNTPFVSAPPGTVDIFVILLSAHHHRWWAYYALMATIGEVLGGYVTYRLAKKGGQQTLEKKIGKSRASKLYKAFEKAGMLTILSGALLPPPFPFTSVLMTAGVMQYPRRQFFSALTIGRAVRFFVIAYFARTYGQQIISALSRYYHPMMDALIVLTIAAALGAITYFTFRRPNIHREKGGGAGKFGSATEMGQMKTKKSVK